MKFKAYNLIERAIDEGINYGYQRAYKHTDNPSETLIKSEIYNAVLNSIDEIVDFENTEDLIYLQESKSVL